MADIVLIIGESGTGKTTSLRNFQRGEAMIVNVSKKRLPFRNQLKTLDTDNYAEIVGKMKIAAMKGIKVIVIDDSQYLMVNTFMRRSGESGYQKYTDIAKSHFELLEAAKELPDGVIVYFLSHLDRDQNGNEKAKTVGKMTDSYITLEGEFAIVLKTYVQDGKYYFRTHNSGYDTVKSPLGMFENDLIDNDLKAVDKTIRDYYMIGADPQEEKA